MTRRRALLALVAAIEIGEPIARAQPPVVRSLAGTRPEIAALLARGGEGGPLRVQAAAFRMPSRESARPLLVVVEIDGASALVAASGDVLGVELAVYLVDAAGAIVGSLSEGIALPLARRPEIESSGIRWIGTVAAPPAGAIASAARIAVRVRSSGRFALREIALGSAAGALATLVVEGESSAWIEARSPGLSSGASELFETTGGAPSALPVVPERSALRVWALVDAAPTAAVPTLVAGWGEAESDLPDTVDPIVDEVRSLPSGGAVIGVTVETPAAASNPRRLTISTGLEVAAASERRLVVRPAGEVVGWNRLPRAAGQGGPTSSPMTPPPAREMANRSTAERLRSAYLAAFREFGAGRREAAIAALQELESATLDGDRRRAMGWLDDADRLASRDVLAARPEALVPLGLLFRDLFRAHLAAGRIGLARRAEGRAEELFVGFGDRDATLAARATALAALEVLAADLLELGAPERASRLLERAARLDGGRASTWLALASIREWQRRPAEARDALAKALAVDPRGREARLRDARLRAADRSLDRRVRPFEELLAEPERDWIAVVAAEEAARALLGAHAFARSIALLERELARFPDEPALALALAYALERSGERAAASAIATRVAASVGTSAPAARRRYAEPPVEALLAGAVRLDEESLVQGPALAAAAGALLR